MTAITIRVWIQLPVRGILVLIFRPKKPSSHRITRITMIGHNMRLILFEIYLSEAARSVTGQPLSWRWGRKNDTGSFYSSGSLLLIQMPTANRSSFESLKKPISQRNMLSTAIKPTEKETGRLISDMDLSESISIFLLHFQESDKKPYHTILNKRSYLCPWYNL